MKLPVSKNLQGFTLIEMMIVMAIFMILFAIGLTSFAGMRDAIAVTENFNNFKQDVRWAQKSSVLLKREIGEWWPYGIGIDLQSTAEMRSQSSNRTYKFFKWCSPFSNFDPNGSVLLNSELPNYNPSVALGALLNNVKNGYMPTTMNTGCTQCGEGACSNTLVELKGRGITQFDSKVDVKFMSDARYILFESVTGRAFLYNANGELLNYSTTGATLDYSPTIKFDIQIQPKDGNISLAKRLNVAPISGRQSEVAATDAAGSAEIEELGEK